MSQIMMNRTELLELLKNHNCQITFTKVDGTDRTGLFTLQEDFLPVVEKSETKVEVESKSKRKVNEDVVVVWDLDKSAWRSFRIDSLKEVKVQSI